MIKAVGITSGRMFEKHSFLMFETGERMLLLLPSFLIMLRNNGFPIIVPTERQSKFEHEAI